MCNMDHMMGCTGVMQVIWAQKTNTSFNFNAKITDREQNYQATEIIQSM